MLTVHSLPVEGEALRGKKLFEAIALGSAVIHGPSVIDFSETYEELDAVRAAILVTEAKELGAAIESNAEAFEQCREQAAAPIAEKKEPPQKLWQLILRHR